MKITESLFLQRHGEKIEAALGCYDRLVITGTLLDVAYPAAVQPHRLIFTSAAMAAEPTACRRV